MKSVIKIVVFSILTGLLASCGVDWSGTSVTFSVPVGDKIVPITIQK